jgi:hypothetical protein
VSVAILAQALRVGWCLIASRPGLATMAELIIAALHGDLLRDIASCTGLHFEGLRSAAGFLRRTKLIDGAVSKRLCLFDDAHNVCRHITEVSSCQCRRQVWSSVSWGGYSTAAVHWLAKDGRAYTYDEFHGYYGDAAGMFWTLAPLEIQMVEKPMEEVYDRNDDGSRHHSEDPNWHGGLYKLVKATAPDTMAMPPAVQTTAPGTTAEPLASMPPAAKVTAPGIAQELPQAAESCATAASRDAEAEVPGPGAALVLEAAVIWLVVDKHQRGSVEFKVKVWMPHRKLMTAYCSPEGLQASQVRFLAHGEHIAPDDAAYTLGIKDGDVINVVEEGEGEDVAGET